VMILGWPRVWEEGEVATLADELRS
jgi:hypothetical protein